MPPQHVAPGYDDLLGERPLVELAQQRAPRIERLIADGVGIGDHGMHNHRLSVFVISRGIAAEDHRQPFRRQSGSAERPDVVMVEGRRLHPDASPAWRSLRGRPLAQAKPRQWILLINVLGEYSEQVLLLPVGSHPLMYA